MFSCTNANITCTGATQVAQYNVQGSNQQTVRISAPNVTLVNQSDSTQDADPGRRCPGLGRAYQLRASRASNFSIGGAVTLNSTTAAGTYVGTFNVTVDY